MPQVGIYQSPEMNAFATGPSKKRSLVAVSTGLLEKMNQQELEGVLGHEISHIANGDMVTMTLIQGVVNAFAMFLSRVISFAVGQLVKDEIRTLVRIVLTIVLDIALSILGTFVVAYFSRIREYKADYDSAKIAGKNNMVAALEGLKNRYQPLDNRGEALATLKISNKRSFLKLLSTHPPLEDRIEALKRTNII
jgi:heat shock protein HtpX